MTLVKIGVRFSFRLLAVVTVGLPLGSFIFCIIYSLIYNFHQVTSTHCKVPNYLPSISAAIGGYTPQRYVWRMGIALHSTPRLVTAVIYYNYYYNLLHDAPQQYLARVAFILNLVENFCLLGLTNISSSENYPIHEKLFITFILCALFYMMISCIIPQFVVRYQLSLLERQSLKMKKNMLAVSIAASMLVAYFFLRHNWYCEPFMYTFFALSEYVVVLSNMAFHMTAYWDFNNQDIYIGPATSLEDGSKASLLEKGTWWTA